MTCPVCGGITEIIDSRPKQDYTRRRRKCTACSYRFTTVEIDADIYAGMKPLNKKAVQMALLDGFENITKQVYNALGIKERNAKDETKSNA